MAKTERAELIRKLHERGLTYDEIGELFAVSRQAVWESAAKDFGDGFRPSVVKKIKYVGLRNWMMENRVTLAELERRCGGRKIRSLTKSDFDPSKKNIDAILAVTGLTYEECFKEDEV